MTRGVTRALAMVRSKKSLSCHPDSVSASMAPFRRKIGRPKSSVPMEFRALNAARVFMLRRQHALVEKINVNLL